jgi:hypothetical protein
MPPNPSRAPPGSGVARLELPAPHRTGHEMAIAVGSRYICDECKKEKMGYVPHASCTAWYVPVDARLRTLGLNDSTSAFSRSAQLVPPFAAKLTKQDTCSAIRSTRVPTPVTGNAGKRSSRGRQAPPVPNGKSLRLQPSDNDSSDSMNVCYT